MPAGSTGRAPVLATRRAALAGTAAGAAIAATAGCDAGPLGSGEPDDAATINPPADADQTLVDQTRTAIATVLAELGGLRGGRDLRARVTTLRRVHEAHLEALGGPPERAPTPVPQRGEPAAVLVRVEQRLQRGLADAAVRAESGTLAKLFASMSASLAMHLAAS